MSLEAVCLLLGGCTMGWACTKARAAYRLRDFCGSEEDVEEDAETFVIRLCREAETPLGIKVDTEDGKALIVQAVRPGGLFAQCNAVAAPEQRVDVGARIICVNGVAGDADAMVEQLNKKDKVLEVVVHLPLDKVLANMLAQLPTAVAMVAQTSQPLAAEDFMEATDTEEYRVVQLPAEFFAVVEGMEWHRPALGITLGSLDEGKVIIDQIEPGGTLDCWNASASPKDRVLLGDRIVNVNDSEDDPQAILEELATPRCGLTLRLQRCSGNGDKGVGEAGGDGITSVEADGLGAAFAGDDTASGGPGGSEPRVSAQPSFAASEHLGLIGPGSLHMDNDSMLVPLGAIRDPRDRNEEVEVIGFFTDCEEMEETLCGAGFLGNHYDLSPEVFYMEAPCEKGQKWPFTNAEAAFQALQFWLLAEQLFIGLSPTKAMEKQQKLKEHADSTFGGFGSAWRAMQAVLAAKFAAETSLARALVCTGDAFLLGHCTLEGADTLWSDNCTGGGQNWIGMQLMLLRDRLTGERHWTTLIKRLVDASSGAARGPAAAEAWQNIVRAATQALHSSATGEML